MFNKLIEVILEFIDDVKCWFVVPVYGECLILRGGRSHKVYGPGIYWKWPFYDQPNHVNVVTTTIGIPVQSFITQDGKEVATKAVCKYNIEDTQKYTEKVYDAVDAIVDITQGHIMRVINTRTWEECNDVDDLSNKITITVRRDVKKYGIYIEQITLTDLVKTPSFRFFTDGDNVV